MATDIGEMVTLLRDKVEALIGDAEKFQNGTNTAGTRVRTGLQDAKVFIKEIREAIMEVRKSRKSE